MKIFNKYLTPYSSADTLPNSYGLLIKGKVAGQSIEEGNIIAFSAVGAGVMLIP